MSVIGRLDEQVNDILISPLEKERRNQRDAEPAAHDERTNMQDELSNPPPHNPPSVSKHKSSEQSPSNRDELPVWLL